MREEKKIAIAGAGTMGASMAETFAKFGFQVVLYDIFPASLEKAKRLIELNQGTEVSEQVITEQESLTLLSRIHYTEDMGCFQEADFVIEAILENMEIKQEFWKEISTLVDRHAILATNTSGLSITEMAKVVLHPERFVGMHWINPPHIIPLIEVIKGELTAEQTALFVRDLAVLVEKKPVIVKDAPGFVLNRIQLAILRECLHIQEQGIASVEAIDDVMKYGLGPRYACLGPFQVTDLGELDIFQNIASYLFADLSDAKESFGLLPQLVGEGNLGVKSKGGFYDYTEGKDEEMIRYRDQMCTKLLKCTEQVNPFDQRLRVEE